MGVSHLFLVVGLAMTTVWGSTRVVVFGQERGEAPTVEAFAKQIKRLDRNDSIRERLEAAEWLQIHSAAKDAQLAVPALERRIREDAEPQVRAAAVKALGAIANDRKEPCPLVIVEAMQDKDEFVSQWAAAHAAQFDSFAPGCVEVLLRGVESEDVTLRVASLLHLPRAGRDDKRVLETLEKATHDETFLVRHNARVAMFQATDNLEEFLAYLIRLQEDGPASLGAIDAGSEAGQRELTGRQLASLGATHLIIQWSDERPVDLARELLKLLADQSPALRRGAARLVGACVIRIDLTDADWNTLLEHSQKPVEPPKPRQKSKLAGELEKLKVEEVLRGVRDEDSDPTVRAAAKTALERLTSAP